AAASPECPGGAEYTGCAGEWLVNHPAVGAVEPGANAPIDEVVLSVLPCAYPPPPATLLEFRIMNEFEQSFAASTTIAGPSELSLGAFSDRFRVALLGTTYVATRITSRANSADPRLHPGIVLIAGVQRLNGDIVVRTEANAYALTPSASGDIFLLP